MEKEVTYREERGINCIILWDLNKVFKSKSGSGISDVYGSK
jgi:hypothetical protein